MAVSWPTILISATIYSLIFSSQCTLASSKRETNLNHEKEENVENIEESLALLCRIFDGRYCSNKLVQMAMQMRTLPAWRKESWSNKALAQLKGYEQLFGERNGVY